MLAPSAAGTAGSTSVDWGAVAKTRMLGAMVGILPALMPAALLVRALDKDGTTTRSLARRAARQVSRALPSIATSAKSALNQFASGGALVVATDVAERELRFLPGHPRVDHVYAMHPLESERYFPLAQFHELLFAQKVSEFVTLLAALGATQVTVRAARGYREAAGWNAAVNAPWDAVAAGENGTRTRSMVQRVEIEERFIPTKPAHVPEGLVWFAHEPTWQAIARRRMEFATDTIKTELQYDEDFGVGADMALALERVGLRIGGSFRSFERTRWEFEATFAQPLVIDQ